MDEDQVRKWALKLYGHCSDEASLALQIIELVAEVERLRKQNAEAYKALGNADPFATMNAGMAAAKASVAADRQNIAAWLRSHAHAAQTDADDARGDCETRAEHLTVARKLDDLATQVEAPDFDPTREVG